jgi:steroid 5-alpha reductase family enzyme
MVAIWAFRMGGYLFTRILKEKSDKRFDQIKIKPLNFLLTWLLQGLWIALTISALLVVMTQRPNNVNNTLIPF